MVTEIAATYEGAEAALTPHGLCVTLTLLACRQLISRRLGRSAGSTGSTRRSCRTTSRCWGCSACRLRDAAPAFVW